MVNTLEHPLNSDWIVNWKDGYLGYCSYLSSTPHNNSIIFNVNEAGSFENVGNLYVGRLSEGCFISFKKSGCGSPIYVSHFFPESATAKDVFEYFKSLKFKSDFAENLAHNYQDSEGNFSLDELTINETWFKIAMDSWKYAEVYATSIEDALNLTKVWLEQYDPKSILNTADLHIANIKAYSPEHSAISLIEKLVETSQNYINDVFEISLLMQKEEIEKIIKDFCIQINKQDIFKYRHAEGDQSEWSTKIWIDNHEHDLEGDILYTTLCFHSETGNRLLNVTLSANGDIIIQPMCNLLPREKTIFHYNSQDFETSLNSYLEYIVALRKELEQRVIKGWEDDLNNRESDSEHKYVVLTEKNFNWPIPREDVIARIVEEYIHDRENLLLQDALSWGFEGFDSWDDEKLKGEIEFLIHQKSTYDGFSIEDFLKSSY